jgi:hypothetical protein
MTARVRLSEGVDQSKVPDFIKQLSFEEREILKMNLVSQIAGFFDDNNRLVLKGQATSERFRCLAETLRSLTPHSETIPSNGIAYRGRPRWVTSDMMVSLQAEAMLKRNETIDRSDHLVGCGGLIADAVSVAPDILDFVSEYVGPVSPTGIASYLFYDRPGPGIHPHVDTNVFSVNLMLMLRHDYQSDLGSSSATVVFPAQSDPESYRLQVGEVMIMHGSSVIHTRSVLQEGEVIHLLTIGFKRLFNDEMAG